LFKTNGLDTSFST